MTDVSVTLRSPCSCPSEGHQHVVSIQSSINLDEKTFPDNVRMNNPKDLNLGAFEYISIIFHISAFLFNLGMVTIFNCWKPAIPLTDLTVGLLLRLTRYIRDTIKSGYKPTPEFLFGLLLCIR